MFLRMLFLMSCALFISSCDQAEEQYQPKFSTATVVQKEEYIFGVHPLHNPQQLQIIYGPLIDFLNSHIQEVTFRLEASRNYAAYEEKLYAGKFQFALPNPYQTILSEDKGYKVFGKMSDDENFRGLILVRKDAGINQVTDLKGKKVSYPAPTALAATMLPQHFIHTHGLDVNKDTESVYVGSQESSIMNVYLKQVAAGATWVLPWQNFLKEKPEMANELEVKWQTITFPNCGLMARKDIPQDLVDKVAQLLFSLHTRPEGQEILARMPLSKFEKADHQTYQVIRDFIQTFSTTIRPITSH
jgi:phosphonate transport system substrate-binding protein